MTPLVYDIERFISKKIGGIFKLGKPWSCSTCMTFWIGMIYLIVNCDLTLFNICILLLISISTDIIQEGVRFIQDLIKRIFRFLYMIIDR